MNFIFDWAGTLSDTFPYFIKVCELMFEEFNKEFNVNKKVDVHEMKKHLTVPYMKFWNHYYPSLTKEHQDKLYKNLVEKISRENPPGEIKGAREILDYLKNKGNKLFVVSSDLKKTLIPDIKNKGFDSYFLEVCAKVHEKDYMIGKLVKKYHMKKSETYYVGDTSGDVLAAKKAGIPSIGFSGGFQHRDLLKESNPDYLIDKLLEIKTLF